MKIVCAFNSWYIISKVGGIMNKYFSHVKRFPYLEEEDGLRNFMRDCFKQILNERYTICEKMKEHLEQKTFVFSKKIITFKLNAESTETLNLQMITDDTSF